MKSKFRKMFIVGLTLAVCSGLFSGIAPSLSPIPNRVAHAATLHPMADVLEWRYKVVDGSIYRRLYNKSKREWAGKWEIC